MKVCLYVLALLLLAGWAWGEEAAPAAPNAADAQMAPPAAIEPPPNQVRRTALETEIFHRQEPVEYASHGRRDPFRPLLVDEKKEGEIETDLLRVEGAILTGVVWSNDEYLAMVKSSGGSTFFLREGDPVYLGRVGAITQSQISFDISDFGEYERVTLKVKVNRGQ